MSFLGLDCGSSSVKACYSEIAKPYRDVSIATVPEFPGKHKSNLIYIDEVGYLVGEDALINESKVREQPNVQPDFHGSIEQVAIHCGVFRDLQLDRVANVGKLALTVPYSLKTETSVIEKLKSKTSYQWEQFEGNRLVKKSVNFDSVEVIPQGVGAAVRHGLLNNPKYETFGVLEVGSVTIEAIVFRWSNKRDFHMYNEEVSSSLRNISISQVYSDLRKRLNNVPGLENREFSYFELCEILENKRYNIQMGSTNISESLVRDKVIETMNYFTENLALDAQDQWGKNLWQRLNRLLISGGGAGLVNKGAWRCADRTIYGDSFDNVIGSVEYFAGK